MPKKITLGMKVKDLISGFVGITIGKTEWITGCAQFIVEPAMKKDGTHNNEWFDENRLVAISTRVIKLKKPDTKPDELGGPKSYPQRPSLPSRR
jgi:hypothetical protein